MLFPQIRFDEVLISRKVMLQEKPYPNSVIQDKSRIPSLLILGLDTGNMDLHNIAATGKPDEFKHGKTKTTGQRPEGLIMYL